jgi:hypothetical protein
VSKSNSSCINHSCACWNLSRECHNHILACQNHIACGKHIRRVLITLGMYKSHSYVWLSHYGHVKIALCVHKSHSACINHALRVKITLVRFKITVLSVVGTFVRVKSTLQVEITLCVYNSHSCVWTSHYEFEHHNMRVNITLCV